MIIVFLSNNFIIVVFVCIIGFEISPIFILFKIQNFFDKDLEFIQPKFPPSKDVVDILYFIAVFSNPIFSI